MVHGSIADHTTFEPFVAVLRDQLTTFSMDRRGFGASGDSAPYAIERDFEDVAAVVDAVAARTGGPVALWGHSYGANCAMGGAALSDNVSRLVLYEPSLGIPYPPGSIALIEAALARGDHDAAIIAVLVDILEMSADEIDDFRSSPLWPVRLAAAPTVARECHAEEDWVYRAGGVRCDQRADVDADRIRQRPGRRRRDGRGGGGDPRRRGPRARGARPLRPQDRPGGGHRHRGPVHRLGTVGQWPRLRRSRSRSADAPSGSPTPTGCTSRPPGRRSSTSSSTTWRSGPASSTRCASGRA